MTGHDNGLITIALIEADDAERERRRAAMRRALPLAARSFPSRGRPLLLGRAGSRRRPARGMPGDLWRRQPGLQCGAAACTTRTGRTGRLAGTLRQRSMPATHPWEDWAETWAHYLHIVDTLEMASAFGITVKPRLTRDENSRAQ